MRDREDRRRRIAAHSGCRPGLFNRAGLSPFPASHAPRAHVRLPAAEPLGPPPTSPTGIAAGGNRAPLAGREDVRCCPAVSTWPRCRSITASGRSSFVAARWRPVRRGRTSSARNSPAMPKIAINPRPKAPAGFRRTCISATFPSTRSFVILSRRKPGLRSNCRKNLPAGGTVGGT